MNTEELKRLALAANAMPPNENEWTDSEFRRYVLAFEQITTPSLVLELIRQLEHHKADSEVNIRLLAEARKNDVHCMAWLADCRIAVDDNGKRMLPEFVEYLKALKQQRDELLSALKEARELVDDWGAYAPAYMQEKHDLKGDLDKLDAAIAKAGG